MIRTLPPAEFARWERYSTLPEMTRSRLGPDSRWLKSGRMMHFVAEDGPRFIGRVSAFVNPRMQDQPLPTGVIGALDFAPEAFDRDEAELRRLLEAAFAWLASNGMRTARGPIDFSTWNAYRAITFSNGYPAFFGENQLDARYGVLLDDMMTPVQFYRSALITDTERAQQVARLARVDRAGAEHGIGIRAIAPGDVLAQMPTLYQLASRIYTAEYAYSPTGADEFHELMYGMSQTAPDFHMLVADAPSGEPIALCFGYAAPGLPKKTAVLRTFGVVPEWQSRNVSYLVAYRFHMDLLARGYENFIHALMREDDRSRHMSDYYATKFRGYTLYERNI